MRPVRARLSLLLLLLSAHAARADGGAWVWFEYRQPVWHIQAPPRLSLRFFSDTRLMAAADGLAQQFVRLGPVFDATSWLTVAVHATIYADMQASGGPEQEARLEAEPTFQVRLWKFLVADRNRLELRWRETGTRVRYRNQLRVTWSPPGARLLPFVWNEWLIDFQDGWNEDRLLTGLGVMLSANVRLEAGYMLRSRLNAGQWSYDHIGVAYLFVGLPPPRRAQ